MPCSAELFLNLIMQCRVHDIVPALQPLISGIWSMETDQPVKDQFPIRILPNTLVEMIIHFREPHQSRIAENTNAFKDRSFMLSQLDRYMHMQPGKEMGFISVFFTPQGVAHFFGPAIRELNNGITGLQLIWKIAAEIEERILGAINSNQRADLLQQYLLKRKPQIEDSDIAVEYCIKQIEEAKGQIRIESLADKTGISKRQLLRRFDLYTGISPKTLARKIKFMNAVEELKKHPMESLTSIAYETGYYDQAHFIHDFREYAGLTPGQYLKEADQIL